MSVSILNNDTTNQEFLDFIVDEIHNAVVSSVNSVGDPAAQVCDMLMVKDMKLYMTTSVKNPFFKCLINNPNIEVNGYKGNGTMDSCGFSLTATIKNINHQYLDEVFEKNPYLNEIYKDNLEQAKQELRILEITPHTGAYLDHRIDPIYHRTFKF